MKRTLLSILLFAMAIMQSMAQDITKNGVQYTINSDGTTVEVSGYDAASAPSDGKITIAATVSDGTKTYDITSIGNDAFRLTAITGVDLSGATNLQTIGEGAFSGTAITGVDLSGATNLQTIGDYAFRDCSSLAGMITIPAKVTSIGDEAFGSTVITGLNLSGAANLQTISEYAFNGCTSLSGAIIIPAKVTSIGDYAFNGTAITALDLSGATALQTIGEYAFNYCSSLAGNLTIPSKVTSIGNGAFSFCFSLGGSVTIPANVTYIGEGVFTSCQSIGSITVDAANANYKVEHEALLTKDGTKLLAFPVGSTTTAYEVPATVTYIGAYALAFCSNQTNITFAAVNNITHIGESAFEGTMLIEDQPDNAVVYIGKIAVKYKGDMPANAAITIKDGTVAISPSIFSNQSNLASVTLPASLVEIGESTFEGSSVTSVNIGGATNLQTIGDNAFNSCTSLSGSLTIPAKVTSIGYDAFYGCPLLSKVFFASTTPPTCGGNIFYGCADDLPLYVNDGQYSYAAGADNSATNIAKYQQAANLTSYANQFAPYLPKTVTGAKIATLYLPYEVAIPMRAFFMGMKAYYGTAVTDGYLKLTALGGTVIPANTPVVLKSDAANFDFISNKGTTALPSGINGTLEGTAADITVGTSKYLTLGESDTQTGTYGFYMYTGETIAANTCYISYPVLCAKGLTLSFSDDATGISNASADAADSAKKVIYDLQGRRVSHPQKGIYIVNGKKIAF